jgi:hypothetical protein
MRTARLRRRRSRAQLALLAAVAALAFLVSGVTAGLVGYLTAATDVGVRSAVAESSGVTPAYEITTRAGADTEAAAAAVTEAAAAAVTEAVARVLPGVPYALHRSLVAGPRSVFRGVDGPRVDRATDDDSDDDRDDDQDDDATAAGPGGRHRAHPGRVARRVGRRTRAHRR